jgi:hypothetical protein
VSGNDCWAAGNTFTTLASQTLIEHYDGSAWSIANSANSTNEQNYLYGVTCTSSNNCWAVGYYANDAGTNILTLTEHYDGTAWLLVNTPNPSNRFTSDLQAISCLDSSNCWAIGYSFDSNTLSQYTLVEHYTVPPVQLNAVVSRKVHGSAGTFDVDLPLTGNSGIECRSGGANCDYTLVFTFANTLTNVSGSSVTSGTGSVNSSNIDNDAHNYIVNLTGVTNAQTITVSLSNMNDSAGDSSVTVSASMGVLLGDVNGSGRVDAADVSLVRQQTLQPITTSNFREDVNASGRIDAADVSITRQQTLTSLP